MRSTADLYATLGVARDADEDAIKRAYRSLAQQYHPDRNPDDAEAEDQFKRVSQAYSVLSDPQQRRNYDEFGDVALDPNFDAERARTMGGGGFQGARGFDPRDMDGMGGFGGLFGDLFGGGGGSFQARPQPGSNLETELELEFAEAARGTERRISVGRPQPDGRVRRDTLTVKIPPGVADGARIRLAGKGGESLQGGPPGDLFAKVRVRPHRIFTRQGQDLHLDIPIAVAEAIFGASIEIPTLDGRVSLRVPAGTDSGSKLRLRGKGLPAAGRNAQGDLYVTLQIRVPKNADPAQREALQALEDTDPDALRQDLFR